MSIIDSGWFQDENSVIAEALRRFLETHKPELMEKFIKEDQGNKRLFEMT